MSTIGIIGGSGVYGFADLKNVEERSVTTPFGDPSDSLTIGELDGVQCVFVPRHGRGHRLLPTEVPYRANIYALKQLGVKRVISVTAVGSMREHIHPGSIVLVDQFIDRTYKREPTFFGQGIAAHVGMGEPTCSQMAAPLAESTEAAGVELHKGGSLVCIEGPGFSTRAESETFRTWGVSVIGMTALPEARLAREAELCYQPMALVTDYDCWHSEEEDVSVAGVVETMRKNSENARTILRNALPKLKELPNGSCACQKALEHAIMTSPEAIPADRRSALDLLIGHRLPSGS